MKVESYSSHEVVQIFETVCEKCFQRSRAYGKVYAAKRTTLVEASALDSNESWHDEKFSFRHIEPQPIPLSQILFGIPDGLFPRISRD
ncbi:hypothetical protein Y032_0314g2223 [Ancylostoma ceylanicum]|uniref:Uncharacterized protein n=1 Tax=Ancylostoma ceylanicum TaxID=53326 RepID=A0A016S1S1_9BILA|nr:hypothetical protein Y032_0314g2223 [Ancylostoma ceylanicum]